MRVAKEGRRAQVCGIVQACADVDSPPTMREIARWLGLKKTPYLEKLIKEMLAQGLLTESLKTEINGHPTRIYHPTDHPYYEMLGNLKDQYKREIYS